MRWYFEIPYLGAYSLSGGPTVRLAGEPQKYLQSWSKLQCFCITSLVKINIFHRQISFSVENVYGNILYCLVLCASWCVSDLPR